MSFEHPTALWALLALLPLAALEWLGLRRAATAMRTLVGDQSGRGLVAHHRVGSRRLGAVLRLAAALSLVVGAAGPQWGREAVRRQAQGSDVVFAIDVSASMDSRDVAPSRLEEARREAYALLDRLPGSRVGIVAFAGDAVRVCPLTLDQAALRMVLSTVGSGSVTTPGTDVGRALRAALKMLPAGRRQEQAIVLWTDGEDNEGHAAGQIDELARSGVRVFAVGVGTPSGDVIPVLDEFGRTVDVKKDEQGEVVRSKLDEKLLRDIGRSTRGGAFFATRAGGELPRLISAMGSLGRSSRGMRMMERPVARFPWFALVAALLLAWDLARARTRAGAATTDLTPEPAPPAKREKPRRAAAPPAKAVAATVGFLLLLAATLGTAHAQSDWARGDQAFRAGRWAQAESLYALRARQRGPAPLKVDLATARALAGRVDEAIRDLGRLTADPGIAGRTAGYNLGTLLGEKGDLDRALGELRRAIERDPSDEDARFNYELLRRRREQQKQQGGQNSQQPPQPQPQPSPGQSGPQQQQQPQPSPNAPPQPQNGSPQNSPNAPQPQQSNDAPQGQGQAGMTQRQADQLLSSLGELERLEQSRMKRMRVLRDRKRKDW